MIDLCLKNMLKNYVKYHILSNLMNILYSKEIYF